MEEKQLVCTIASEDNSLATSAYVKESGEYTTWIKVGVAMLEVKGIEQLTDVISMLCEILGEIAPEALEEAYAEEA